MADLPLKTPAELQRDLPELDGLLLIWREGRLTTASVEDLFSLHLPKVADKSEADMVASGAISEALGGKLNRAGNNLLDRLLLLPATVDRASINVPVGTSPATAENGDLIHLAAGLLIRRNNTFRTVYDSLNLQLPSEAEARAGAAATVRAWSAQRDGQAIEEALASQLAGGIEILPGATIPAGRRVVKLNGATLSRSAYPFLWAYAQASGHLAASEGAKTPAQFGPGDGSTTFTLPDWRGYFIRAWDDGRGIDAGRALSTIQAQAMQAHYHRTAFGFDTTAFYALLDGGGNPLYGSDQASASRSVTSAGSNSVGAYRAMRTDVATATTGETRPVNITALFGVRF